MTAPPSEAASWPSGSPRPVVGCIGLGSVGGRVAGRIRAAGFELVVFDARAEATEPLVAAGAVAAESAPGAAASCDVLVTMLPGPAQVAAVMLGPGGALQALRAGSVWVDASTATPGPARAAAVEGAPHGVAVVDAPVLATDAGARVLAGGEAGDVERVRPVLEAMAGGEEVLHAGPLGAGYAAKLCLDLLEAVRAAAADEVVALGRRAGVDAGLLDRLVGRPTREQSGEGGPEPATAGVPAAGPDPATAVAPAMAADAATSVRSLALAVDLAREVGVPLELSALVEQLLRRGAAGSGDVP